MNQTHDTAIAAPTHTPDVSGQPPRWAVWAAYAVPLCLLPSCAWRVSLVTTDLSNIWYPVLLSVLEMSFGLLTLGAIVIIGLSIYGILNDIFNWVTPEMARAMSPQQFESSGLDKPDKPGVWVAVLYAPTLAWGPLLLAVTVAYYRRRSA